MIQALTESREQVRQHQALLEQRIQQRTEDVGTALGGADANSEAKSESLADLCTNSRTPMSGVIGMIDGPLASSMNAGQTENP